MPGWVRRGTRVAAGLGEEAEPWSVVVFKGVGLVAWDGRCGGTICVLCGYGGIGVSGRRGGKSLGWSCGRESRYKALGRECIQSAMTMKYTVAVNFLHASAYLDSDRICLGKGGSYSKNILQLKLATEKK